MKPTPILAGWALAALSSCASYAPQPLEPLNMLEQLEAQQWPSPSTPQAGEPSLGPRELTAFALQSHPELLAFRAQIGIREALLVEAGLFDDPEFSWDAMDIIASESVTGSSSRLDALGGLGLMFQLPRPGERRAKKGAARAGIDQARSSLLQAEWRLALDVHLAYEELLLANELLLENQNLEQLALTTFQHFQAAQEAGAATGIQANLAGGALGVRQLEVVYANERVLLAHLELNELLGVSPDTRLQPTRHGNPAELASELPSPEQLLRYSLTKRPELLGVVAEYQEAEELLRLAYSKQYPTLAVGTGVAIGLPLLSRFARPAIATALANRHLVRLRYLSVLHEVRAQIHAAQIRWTNSESELQLIGGTVLPNAEENLRLSEEALAAGESTLLETLALQSALVQARTQHLEAQGTRRKTSWSLLAAGGDLLNANPAAPSLPQTEQPR
ncbi:MAG: TolC family protein [Planctomycetes bacterium]|nr:TolC family protein [Planctomycetota bacterium]